MDSPAFDLYFLCTFSSLPALSGFIRAQNILAVFMDSLLPGHLELAENATRRVVLKDHALPGFRMSKRPVHTLPGYIHTESAATASCCRSCAVHEAGCGQIPRFFSPSVPARRFLPHALPRILTLPHLLSGKQDCSGYLPRVADRGLTSAPNLVMAPREKPSISASVSSPIRFHRLCLKRPAK